VASFLLRNVIDGVGVEIRFENYDPAIQEIEVLRFARRRRAKLYYLRDRSAKVWPAMLFL
jgi:large subunit ribosomal protein L19